MKGVRSMLAARRILATAIITTVAASALAGCGSTATSAPAAPPVASDDVSHQNRVTDRLRALESEFDARVGIAALDTGDGDRIEYRADERFGYASTVKALAAAQFLREVKPADREERVTWTQEDVDTAGYSPVTSQHVSDGLTLAQLAEAAVRESDNTALNLILERIGGPAGLDAGLGRLGDTTTEVVNTEPDLNTIERGSTDDTTTPAAFTADLTSYLQGPALKRRDRAILIDWMSRNATGDNLIRAGAPERWVVADKSGGAGAIRNDIAIITPPGRAPILLTILTTKNDPEAEYDDELVARSAALVLDTLR